MIICSIVYAGKATIAMMKHSSRRSKSSLIGFVGFQRALHSLSFSAFSPGVVNPQLPCKLLRISRGHLVALYVRDLSQAPAKRRNLFRTAPFIATLMARFTFICEPYTTLLAWHNSVASRCVGGGEDAIDASAVGPWVGVVHPRVGFGEGVDVGPFEHANGTIIFRLMGWDAT